MPDARQARMVALMGLMSVAFHAVVLVSPAPGYGPVVRVVAAWGLLGSALIAVLGRRPEQTHVVRLLTLLVMLGWLTLDFAQGVQSGRGLTPWMVLDTVLAGVLVLSVLPFRLASWGLAGLYVVFLGAAWAARERDVVLLVYLAFLLVLTRFLVAHGEAAAQGRVAREALERQLRYDALTGALTRQALEADLAEVLRVPGQVGNALLMVDVDHFKVVNDTRGHLVGDRALQWVADVLKVGVGPGGRVCRWGGEEFVVLLQGFSVQEAQGLAEQLRARVAAGEPGSGLPALTVSVGLALLDGVQSVEDGLARVDERLYVAKAEGRNHVA